MVNDKNHAQNDKASANHASLESSKAQDEVNALREATHSGAAAAKSNQYGKFFLDVHNLEALDAGNSGHLNHDLSRLNDSLKLSGISVSIDASYSDQIDLNKTSSPGSSPQLTSTFLKAGGGRDAQVITDANHNVITGGITYYENKNGKEIAVSHGSTDHQPTQGMFEETQIETQAGLQAAMQRLDVMHSMGIRKVVLSVDEADPALLKSYAEYGASMKPPMSFVWNLSGGNGKLCWENMQNNDAAGIFEKYRDQWENYNAGTPTNAQLLNFMVAGDPAHGIAGLKDLPGTVGYYAGDDSNIPSSQSPEVQNVNSYLTTLRQLDPNAAHSLTVGTIDANSHQRALWQQDMNGKGSVVYEEYPLGYSNDSFAKLGANGQPYLPESKADTFYSGDNPAAVKKDLHAAQVEANKNHEPLNLALSAFQWDSSSPYPSFSQQVGLRNMALANAQAKNFYWYWMPGNYPTAGDPNSPQGSRSTQFISTLAASINAPLPYNKYWRPHL